MKRIVQQFASIGLVSALLMLSGCSKSLPNRDPSGEMFPNIEGESLEGERVELPSALKGEPAILLIGYEQKAQFDIDRWLLGLIQAEADARILELPTIPGLTPTLASGWIDDGMRSGIPREDWGVVVTLYGAAAKPVAALTGTENGQVARIVILDSSGTVIWFDDTGYAPRKALAVASLITELNGT